MLNHESLPELANRVYNQYYSGVAQSHGNLCPCDLCAHYRQEYKIDGVKRFGILIPPKRRFLERQDDGLGPIRGLMWVSFFAGAVGILIFVYKLAMWLWRIL